MASQALGGAAPGGGDSGVHGGDSGAPAALVLVGNVGQVGKRWAQAYGTGQPRKRA